MKSPCAEDYAKVSMLAQLGPRNGIAKRPFLSRWNVAPVEVIKTNQRPIGQRLWAPNKSSDLRWTLLTVYFEILTLLSRGFTVRILHLKDVRDGAGQMYH